MTPTAPKLSICIGTFNRARLLGETLSSIIPQMTDACEVLVSDNASTDDTQQVVAEHAHRFDRLRYFRQETNVGLDRNFDRAVELARGDYCWLFSDDDLMKPNAVARVLEALQRNFSLVVTNTESRDFSMSNVLQKRWLKFDSDRIYESHETDRLFVEMDDATRVYLGNTIFRRSIWLARDRDRYFGSIFIHVGVLFQEQLPGPALIIAEPLASYRMGNWTTYTPQSNEMMLSKWPAVVESLALSKWAKNKVASGTPWRNPHWLFFLRAWGRYSMNDYRQWIRPRSISTSERLACITVALLPGVLANLLLLLYYSARGDRGHLRHLITQSPFYVPNMRPLKRNSNW